MANGRDRHLRQLSERVTMRTERGQRTTGWVPGSSSWTAGWERLLADVLGRGHAARVHLYDALAADDLGGPWSRQELDALWAAAHGDPH